MKSVWRSMFGSGIRTLPTMSFAELTLLIRYTVREINSIPYPNQTDLSPSSIIGHDRLLPVELELDIQSRNTARLSGTLKTLQSYRQLAMDEIKRLKLASETTWRMSTKGKHDYTLKTGDIVIIKGSDNSCHSEKIGEVLAITNTTASVKSWLARGPLFYTDVFRLHDLVLLVRPAY